MSKIAFKSNDSGTGTFEIQAPATNTNRVLELPDEAGKVLTTGNNDPAEVFKQDNILGTVSESGGVPTGAIIESGSNSNGEFVKYADGTMICRKRFGDVTVTIDLGSVARSVPFTWTYPSPFVSRDTTSISVASHNNSWSSSGSTQPTSTFVDITCFSHATGQIAGNPTVTAIGRWY